MKTFAIVGDDGTLADRVVDRLAERGRVTRIRRSADASSPEHGSVYRIGDDGDWSGTGTGSLDGLLDRVTPNHDYAVLEGHRNVSVPRVVVGDPDRPGDAGGDRKVLFETDDADSADLEALVELVEDLEPRETLGSLVARAKTSESADRAGAIATFTGRVREKDHPDDERTEYLEFEKYDGVAERRMETIREELTDRDGVFEVLLHHRTGVVEAGEDIVFVVVLAGHRREAFRTVEDGIDRLKDEVPLFKREVTVEEEFWVHERE